MSSKRSCKQGNDTVGKIKKTTIDDDLVCPITLELPLDPVIAEDGRFYDREAIQKHIESQTQTELRSPYTNERMGPRLLPSLQHRNLIRSLIEKGTITGPQADRWILKAKDEKKQTELLEAAEAGETTIMINLSLAYRDGNYGFQKNNPSAFYWMKQAHDAGSILATAFLGDYYLKGTGIEKCFPRGLVYTSMAAEKCDIASYNLGMAIAHGYYGMPIDTEEAVLWLRKSINGCIHRNLLRSTKDKAKKIAQQLQERNDS